MIGVIYCDVKGTFTAMMMALMVISSCLWDEYIATEQQGGNC